MNPEDKKKLQNDILLAAEISRQFNIHNHDEVAKVVEFVHARKPFLSPRGLAFQQRMEALCEDENTTCTCMLCMQREAERGIFCDECLEVIDRSVNRDAKPQPQEEEAPEEEAPIEEAPVEELPEEEFEEEILEVAPEEVEFDEALEEELPIEELSVDEDLWGEPEKETKKRKLPIWAWVLIGLFLVVMIGVGVVLATGYQLPIGTVHVETAEDGESVVAHEYSDKDYDIIERESLNAPEGMFEVRVGEYVGDSWNTGLISVYAYSVVSKEDPSQSAVLWVAEDGRTVGYGSLIDSEDPNKIYRIR
jgi:hypothetical protein